MLCYARLGLKAEEAMAACSKCRLMLESGLNSSTSPSAEIEGLRQVLEAVLVCRKSTY